MKETLFNNLDTFEKAWKKDVDNITYSADDINSVFLHTFLLFITYYIYVYISQICDVTHN